MKINNFTLHEYVGDYVLPVQQQSFRARCDRKKKLSRDIDQVFRSRARIIHVFAVASSVNKKNK